MANTEIDEVELKLEMPEDVGDVLGIVRDNLPRAWSIVRRPPGMAFDVYFDTPDRLAHRTQISFRCRRWKQPFAKHPYNANFKHPPAPDALWSRRVEVKSKLSVEDVLRYRTGAMPGKAASAAYEWLEAHGGRRDAFLPTVQLTSHRETFGVVADRADCFVILVIVDHIAVTRVAGPRAEAMIRTGSLAWSPTDVVCRSAEVEVELNTIEPTAAVQGEGRHALQAIAERCHAGGLAARFPNKYSRALALLDGTSREGG